MMNPLNMNSKSVRAVRRIEPPRPLKSNREMNEKIMPTISDINMPKKPVVISLSDSWSDLQTLCSIISDCNYDENTPAVITRLCNILKSQGQDLDAANKSLMDHYFAQIRNTSREDRLDMVSRSKLLEVIEIRAMKWQSNEYTTAYYSRKVSELEGGDKVPALVSPIAHNYSILQSSQVSTPAVSIPLAPGEILRSSGKYAKPTKIVGKNYYKDEVVIRNSDSGKVNPGARDRLVQITGPNEESISHAKTLVEDTIRRNASPLREKVDSLSLDMSESSSLVTSLSFDDGQDFSRKQQLAHSFSMSDAMLGEYSSRINIGVDFITLSGSNAELLKHAKVVLQSYFSSPGDDKEKVFPLASEDPNYENSKELKNKLERSFSWMSSGGGRSSSESFSDDDGISEKKASSIHSPLGSRKTSLNSEAEEIGSPIEVNKVYILEDILSGSETVPGIPPPEPKKAMRVYTKSELIKYSKSPLCNTTAIKLNEEVIENHPFILKSSSFRKEANAFDVTHQ